MQVGISGKVCRYISLAKSSLKNLILRRCDTRDSLEASEYGLGDRIGLGAAQGSPRFWFGAMRCRWLEWKAEGRAKKKPPIVRSAAFLFDRM